MNALDDTQELVIYATNPRTNLLPPPMAWLFPAPADRIGEPTGEIHTRERLGGLRKFYYRELQEIKQIHLRG